MRIVCVSDTHGVGPLPELPACDLLLVAGDLACRSLDAHDLAGQRRYLAETVAPWLDAAPARHRLGIAGNHDLLAAACPDAFRELPWRYLEDETVEIEGLRIHGTPWTPPFKQWAFMLPERELATRFALIPDDCDLLLSHGPSFGYGDDVSYGPGADPANPHAGSTALRYRVDRLPNLLLHVLGHIHQGAGEGVLARPGLAPLRWVNASRLDAAFAPTHPPLVIDL